MSNVSLLSRSLFRHRSLRGFSLAAALSAALLSGFLFGCAEGSTKGDQAAPAVSAEFRLPSLDGQELGPPDYTGRIVVVDFWATWCVPCRKQAEVLHALHETIEDSAVQFLAVDLGEDEATVRQYLENDPIPYPVLLDVEDNLTYEMGIYGLPTLMVVDAQGKVTYFETGLVSESELRQELSRAGYQS